MPFQIQNFRNQAEAILKFVRQKNLTESPDFTITQFIEGLLKGSKCKKFTDEEHVQLRALVAQLWRFEKADLDRLLRKMICDDLLSEDLHRIQNDEKDYLMSYLRLGAQANSLFSDAAFQFNFPVETRCVPPIAEEDSKSTEDYQKLLEKFGELEGAYKRLQEEHQKLQEEHRKLQEEHQRTRRAALDDEDLIKFDPIDSEPVQATHPIKLERVQPATPPATSTNDGGSGRKRKRDETAEHWALRTVTWREGWIHLKIIRDSNFEWSPQWFRNLVSFGSKTVSLNLSIFVDFCELELGAKLWAGISM